MKRKTLKGIFRPRNPSKYKGNASNIVYRSSWELSLFMKLDTNPDILQWSSEETPIPYKSPLDGKLHRYFPDVWIKTRTKDGLIEESIIEIKPFRETIQPVQGEKSKRSFAKEVMTYAINQAKWETARKYCEQKNMKFLILTENELGIKR